MSSAPSADGTTSGAAPPAPVRVDSIHPPEEQLRRFREGIPMVAALSGGSDRIEDLAARFAAAVATADTAELGRIALSRAEFAYLYFPTSPFSRPPMRQDPALTWFLIRQNSEKGLTRVLRRYGPGGAAFRYAGMECAGSPEEQGDNRLWSDCRLLVRRPDGSTEAVRWFGTVLERDGHYKLVSYANDL